MTKKASPSLSLRAQSAAPAPSETQAERFLLFGGDEGSLAADVVDDSAPVGRFSNFVVYVDESGDHGLQTVDANYPVFVLSFCVFPKRYYCDTVVPALQKFKFKHFGHDIVVLHEHEIRKEKAASGFPAASTRMAFSTS